MKKVSVWVAVVLCAVGSFASSVFTCAVPSEGGSVSGGGTYENDVADVLLQATPNAGYEFAGWYLDSGCENPVLNPGVGGYLQNPIHVYPHGKPSFYAKFIPSSQIHVTGCALPKNGGLVESVDTDGITTFTAIPNTGYRFAGWFLDTGCHTIFSTDSSLNYLQNPISCVSSSNIVLNAKFVQSLPSWAVGKWSGSLDFHHHGDNEVGDTATFVCDVNEDGWWNSTCVWVNMGTNIVEATATNIINVSSSEVKLEGYYYCENYYVWQMTLSANGQSTFRSMQVNNGTLCVGGCEKMSSKDVAVPAWVEGLWIGSLDYHVGEEVGVSDRAEFKCMISTNGSWQATCKWDSMGAMVVSASSTVITNISSEEISISGCYYYCSNRFDWEMRLRNNGESSFHATKVGDDDSLSGTLSKNSSSPATPTIVSVTAQQNYSVNGAVDIVVTIQGDEKTISKTDCLFAATNSSKQTSVPVVAFCQVGYDSFSDGMCTRHYTWNAKTDIGSVKIDGLVLTVILRESQVEGVQLWENGPYWDECNIGATKPEEYGYYFWWGDTVGYKRNTNDDGWVSANSGAAFSFTPENCPTYGKDKSVSALQAQGYLDSTGNLAASNDAATKNLGEPWRLPTDSEMAMLVTACTTTWIKTNGVFGRLITGKGDYSAKSVFLPAAGGGYGSLYIGRGSDGYYWTSTPYSSDPGYACELYFVSGSCYRFNSGSYLGQSIRPVRDAAAVFANATIHINIDCREIPDLGEHPTIDEITNVFNEANAEDPKLAQKITNETEYVAFREWSEKVKSHGGSEPIGAAGVLAAPNAWLSYALGSDSLIDAVPTNGQMRVEKFEPTSTAGSFDFTIAIDDIAVGSEATKENLKKVFGLEGGATLDALSSTNIDISFGTPENGKVKFTAGPKNANEGTFFMRVKMTP